MSEQASALDLRSFLEAVSGKGPGHHRVIDREISPRWMTTAVVRGLAKRFRNPVIEFRSIEGCRWPMVTNVCASVDRVAKSVGIDRAVLEARFGEALTDGVPPIVVPPESAPVRTVEAGPGEFSLHQLPSLFYSAGQSAPYITAAIVIGFDPDSGAHNLSFNRFMIDGDHTAAIYMTPGGHLDQICEKNRAAGQSTPVALAIGTHPLWSYAALVAGDLDDEDYEAVGAVLGGPLALTPSRVDERLLVPARAEVLLEGTIEMTELREEGPFGEFLGYMAERAPRPTVQLTRLSTRTDPIYQDIVAGQTEHLTMSSVTLRSRLHRDYFRAIPAVTGFRLPAPMTVFISIDSLRHPDFDAGAFMEDLLEREAYLKYAYVFDADVDLGKVGDVHTALSCFSQPGRDMTVYRDRTGNGIDPSEEEGRTSKVAIDARARKAMVRSDLPEEVLADFDLGRWLA